MKKTSLVARAAIVAAVGLTAGAASASPAQASGFTLELTAPPAVVGHPIVLNATGTIPMSVSFTSATDRSGTTVPVVYLRRGTRLTETALDPHPLNDFTAEDYERAIAALLG